MRRLILIILFIGSLLLLGCTTKIPSYQESRTATPSIDLQLLSLTNEREYDYITVSGEVKNISDINLHNILAVVSYYTENKTYVKTNSALIEYNPILPGQISPFTVYTTDNPAIKRYSVSFKELMGGAVSCEDARKKATP